jgi:DNA polymerase III delta prime subunit
MAIPVNVNTTFWCERVQKCFQMFVENPHTLQHLLLYGPPGSGKTTSAAWLVDTIWKQRKSLMCMSMNAADERSLESIRQKVFPFINVDWRSDIADKRAPRFLILDECETLTEAAQLSLQTILNTDPRDICVILICNSQSRIHPKLRQRLLRIRYDPPTNIKSQIETDRTLFTSITRGDLRLVSKKTEIDQKIFTLLNGRTEDLYDIINSTSSDYQNLLSDILLFADYFKILDDTLILKINYIYPYLSETVCYNNIIIQKILEIMNYIRQKFDTLNSQNINVHATK